VRTPYAQRKVANFSRRITKQSGNDPQNSYTVSEKLTVAQALDRLQGELRRLYAQRVIVSTNVPTRIDGLPYSNAREPEDPGVAVYFLLKNAPRVLACDRWKRVADNIAAIAGHIDALRAQERYGVGTLEQAFAGYAALPPTADDWAIVLGVKQTATREEIIAAHRKLATEHHPDKGGRLEDMARINAARDLALKARKEP
jgi:hypothetical protein